MSIIYYSDWLEKEIGEILESKGIEFIHESQNNGSNLDFYLPKFDVYIEVKQYYSERIIKQISSRDNVILIQGKKSLEFINQINKQ